MVADAAEICVRERKGECVCVGMVLGEGDVGKTERRMGEGGDRKSLPTFHFGDTNSQISGCRNNQ